MQKKTFFTSILLIWLSCVIPCFANDEDYQQKHLTTCGNHYVQQSTPQSLSKPSEDLYYLCFEGFAVGFSGKGKVALWSAEHLTKERLLLAETLERKDNFHEESQLPSQFQATLKDYKNVPYDRGHLAPNADMATLDEQYESFSLANIVPQNPSHNRGIWRSIETRTRYLTLKYGEVYVVTGTAFLGKTVKKINQNVIVPTHFYKAIYIPSIQQAGVYFSPNNDSGLVKIISLNELASRIGYDIMPRLDISVQNHAYTLPMENLALTDKATNNNDTPNNFNIFDVLTNLALMLLKWLLSLLQN